MDEKALKIGHPLEQAYRQPERYWKVDKFAPIHAFVAQGSHYSRKVTFSAQLTFQMFDFITHH